MVGIKDTDFMKHCDASYKLNIRFTNFHTKNSGYFDYPFGSQELIDDNRLNLWYFKKIIYPDTKLKDYANSFFPIMSLVNNNKVFENNNKELGNWNIQKDTAFHFDATKFGLWLRDKICIPLGLNHIKSNVKQVKTNESGISYLILDNNDKIKSDLFIDCTGFKSLLLGQSLKEKFISYSNILPNNKAWATHVDYKNKNNELVGNTECTALKNGWVWNIPLYSKIGTGYVYSDKYITDEQALDEFKKHLKKKHNISKCKFINIPMKIGIYKRLFVNNVCAIGLSAGFIEPLESNGLYTVHEFLFNLVRILERKKISQFDKDTFNYSCRNTFHNWAEFVSLHYAFSERDDSKYWKDNMNRIYDKSIYDLLPTQHHGFRDIMIEKMYNFRFNEKAGINCIATGMNWLPMSDISLRYSNKEIKFNYEKYKESINLLDSRKKTWDNIVKYSPNLYQYLKSEIYQ
jgi:tryptophan halogenase